MKKVLLLFNKHFSLLSRVEKQLGPIPTVGFKYGNPHGKLPIIFHGNLSCSLYGANFSLPWMLQSV